MWNKIILSVAMSAEPQFTFLEKGEIAPFEGTLFDPSASVVLSLKPMEIKEICALDTKHEIEIITAKCSMEKDLLVIRNEALTEEYKQILELKDRQIDKYKELLLKKEKPNKWLYFAGGVILGGAVIYKTNQMVNNE